MSLDITKLQNVKKSADGKIIARCPVCQAAGADGKGDHLVVYPDGRYGCVANPDDKQHSKEIFRLAGLSGARALTSQKISVNAVDIPPPQVIMELGKFSRFSRQPLNPKELVAPTQPVVGESLTPEIVHAPGPAMRPPAKRVVSRVASVARQNRSLSELSATDEEVAEFLKRL